MLCSVMNQPARHLDPDAAPRRHRRTAWIVGGMAFAIFVLFFARAGHLALMDAQSTQPTGLLKRAADRAAAGMFLFGFACVPISPHRLRTRLSRQPPANAPRQSRAALPAFSADEHAAVTVQFVGNVNSALEVAVRAGSPRCACIPAR